MHDKERDVCKFSQHSDSRVETQEAHSFDSSKTVVAPGGRRDMAFLWEGPPRRGYFFFSFSLGNLMVTLKYDILDGD